MYVCFLLSTWRSCITSPLSPPPHHHLLLLLPFDTRNKGRLTSSVCRSFASLVIPANLCDHWGRIVHHIQLWFPALSSQSKVGRLSADTELLHEVNIYERRGARERRRKKHSANRRKALRKQSPYNASISGKGAKNWVFSILFGKVVGRRCQSLIQYGARLRSKFQDTNMEVSRLPIPLKVARLGGGRVQSTVASAPLTTVP